MKKLTLLVAIILCTYRLYSQCANPDNIYTFYHNDKKYEVVKEMKTWALAATCAAERGGHLVEINDVNEQNAVYNAIINGAGVSPNYTQVSNGGDIAYVWIGATDQATEGTWLWDGNNDGQGVNFWIGQGANGAGGGTAVNGSYHNWGGKSNGTPNEPDNWSGQHHGAIGLQNWPSGSGHLGSAGEWNDIIDSSPLYFVIEMNTSTSSNGNSADNVEFKIYPNPSNGIIRVEGTYRLVEVFDPIGRLLMQQENGNILDISNLSKNIYYLRVSNDLMVETKKIILN